MISLLFVQHLLTNYRGVPVADKDMEVDVSIEWLLFNSLTVKPIARRLIAGVYWLA